MKHGTFSWTAILAALALLSGGCREREAPGPTPSLSPSAHPDLVADLRLDLEADRHPSDGGGRVRIESGPPTLPAGDIGSWTFIYEAGPLGIAEGGYLFFQVSPFWGWSTPQVVFADGPGFSEVSTAAAGVELNAETLGDQLLGIRIGGRRLEPGERVRVVYGAGPAGARGDRFAERESRFWFAVDGDGDGVRGLIEGSPSVEITAGPPRRLVLTLPSLARVGDVVRGRLAVLDRAGNAGVDFVGTVELSSDRAGITMPEAVRLESEDRGLVSVELEVKESGALRLTAAGPDGLTATSNPLLAVGPNQPLPSILWADLHGHSALSDGTATPRDYLLYARDVAALDVVALTDHDHWGLEPLSRHPELWEEIRRETESLHRPGEFVTLLGYEWTSWLHGHRHVLYFEGDGEVFSSVDARYETPTQLWDALRGRPALTFAHHSAGGPVATNWEFAPDPELEPVTEIVSVHGSSEAADSPFPIYSPVGGNFVRDVLNRGYRLGFIGSGDGHDGHPGLSHLASASGGLAAILTEEHTREGVLEALRARRVYATNGPRILLFVALDGHRQGSSLPATETAAVEILVVAVEPIERVEVIRSGRIVQTVAGTGRAMELALELDDLSRGEYLYVRVVQIDGGGAWSSPFFVE